MAGLTSAIIGGTGLLMSGYQMIDGKNREKRANRELSDYERQELNNAFKDISISTLGSDLLREENARTSAGLTDAAVNGGSRTIIGAVPKITGYTNQINQQAAKMLDDQVINREYAIAGDNSRIEGITEQRDRDNIGALSSQANAGRQDSWNGLMGFGSSLGYLSRSLDRMPQERDYQTPVSELKPKGLSYNPSQPFFNTPYSAPLLQDYFTSNGNITNPYPYL